MKNQKLTQTEREILKRLEAARFRRNLSSKHKAADRRKAHEYIHDSQGGDTYSPTGGQPQTKFTQSKQEIINLPPTLDLITHFEDTAKVIRNIRRIALRGKRPAMLDFSGVKVLKPSALLLLLAEINRCRLLRSLNRLTGSYPTDRKIERMLDATGFFRLLGVKSRIKRKPSKYPMEYVGFLSAKSEIKGTVKKFRESLLGTTITMSPQARSRLYRGITEAMLNVGQHAYTDHSRDALPGQGRWWLTGHVNRKAGTLTVMFCDLGVGIPNTLPKVHGMELIRAALSILPGIKPNDGQMVQAGMEIGRTSTGKAGRGRGLNDLRKFVEDTNAGELHIFSRKGHYRYKPMAAEQVANYNISMGGTLIMWTVPMSAVTNWKSNDMNGNEDETEN